MVAHGIQDHCDQLGFKTKVGDELTKWPPSLSNAAPYIRKLREWRVNFESDFSAMRRLNTWHAR
jgi:hypothetical protein